MSDTLILKKEDLLALLREKLAEAEGWDATVAAKHKAEEQEWTRKAKKATAEFAAKVRSAKTYEDVRALAFKGQRSHFDGTTSYYHKDLVEVVGALPSCPLSQATKVRRAINFIETDGRTRPYQVKSGGNLDGVWSVLVWTPAPLRADLCA